VSDLVQHAKKNTNLREFRVASRRIVSGNVASPLSFDLISEPSVGLLLVLAGADGSLVVVDVASSMRFISVDSLGQAIQEIDQAPVGKPLKIEFPDMFSARILEMRQSLASLTAVPQEIARLTVDDRSNERLAVTAAEWLNETFKALMGGTTSDSMSLLQGLLQARTELAKAKQGQNESLAAQKVRNALHPLFVCFCGMMQNPNFFAFSLLAMRR